MVAFITGVVYEAPVATGIPPVAAVYQLTVAALVVAPKVTVPRPQRVPGVVPVRTGESTVQLPHLTQQNLYYKLSPGGNKLFVLQPPVYMWKS